MASAVTVSISRRDAHQDAFEVPVDAPPAARTAEMAREVLHAIIMATGASWVVRIAFDAGRPGPLAVLTVETDMGTAFVTLVGLSADVLLVFERMVFTVPTSLRER